MVAAAHDARPTQRKSGRRRCHLLRNPPRFMNDQLVDAPTRKSGTGVVQAHETLRAEGIRSRVVSMPSWEILDHQTLGYRDSVLPPDVKARVAMEQASTLGWER
jgi:hypothetical protein